MARHRAWYRVVIDGVSSEPLPSEQAHAAVRDARNLGRSARAVPCLPPTLAPSAKREQLSLSIDHKPKGLHR